MLLLGRSSVTTIVEDFSPSETFGIKNIPPTLAWLEDPYRGMARRADPLHVEVGCGICQSFVAIEQENLDQYQKQITNTVNLPRYVACFCFLSRQLALPTSSNLRKSPSWGQSCWRLYNMSTFSVLGFYVVAASVGALKIRWAVAVRSRRVGRIVVEDHCGCGMDVSSSERFHPPPGRNA